MFFETRQRLYEEYASVFRERTLQTVVSEIHRGQPGEASDLTVDRIDVECETVGRSADVVDYTRHIVIFVSFIF